MIFPVVFDIKLSEQFSFFFPFNILHIFYLVSQFTYTNVPSDHQLVNYFFTNNVKKKEDSDSNQLKEKNKMCGED